jgi:nucleoside 2-deoxyribosyltransferase
MKLFCSTAMTGENEVEVTERMKLVVDTLQAAGWEAYCQSLDPHVRKLQQQGVKAQLDYAFEVLATCEALAVIVTSDRRSEGVLMEVGAALAAKKPVYLFWHELADANGSHLPKIATKVFEWQSEDELSSALQQLGKGAK